MVEFMQSILMGGRGNAIILPVIKFIELMKSTECAVGHLIVEFIELIRFVEMHSSSRQR